MGFAQSLCFLICNVLKNKEICFWFGCGVDRGCLSLIVCAAILRRLSLSAGSWPAQEERKGLSRDEPNGLGKGQARERSQGYKKQGRKPLDKAVRTGKGRGIVGNGLRRECRQDVCNTPGWRGNQATDSRSRKESGFESKGKFGNSESGKVRSEVGGLTALLCFCPKKSFRINRYPNHRT